MGKSQIFFDYFNKRNHTKGKEKRTQAGYNLDYIDDDLKLIVEWDETYHNSKKQKVKDIMRQNLIMGLKLY